jgi:phosphotransferase system HPr (HPr) family protein
MVQQELDIVNPTGLHARPASQFCTLAGRFRCNVTIHFKDKQINGKSPLNVMTGGLKMGSRILLICNGEDEEEALGALCEFINNLEE